MTTADSTETRLTDHLIEAAVLRARVEHVEQLHQSTSNQVLHALGEMSADLKAIRTDIAGVPAQIQSCRADVRREIERDFPNKEAALTMEKRIEDQIVQTDRALGVQIAEVKSSLGDKISDLSGEVQTVKQDVAKIWIKVVVAVAAVAGTAASFMWLLDFIEKVQK